MTENRRPFDELRVIGSPQGFQVYDSARRKLNILALDLFLRPGNAPLMQIAMPAGNIDVVGKSLFAVVDPVTGKPRVVKRIEWADGQSTDFPEPEKVQAMANPAAGVQEMPPMRQNGPGAIGEPREPAVEPTGPAAPNEQGHA